MASSAKTQIANLKDFLEVSLRKTILDYSMRPLTKPGDHYGSIIQALTVTVADECNKSTEVLELVAKTVVTNEYLVSIFQPTITSIKENAYYSKLIPAMKKIQDEHNIPESKQINIFVKCIGCRHSLDKGAEKGDLNALLLLENIKFLGFENGNRLQGFDANTSYKILEGLAEMHALPIAIRLLKPKQFEETFRPHSFSIDMSGSDPDSSPKILHSILQYVDGIEPQLMTRVTEQFDPCLKFGRDRKMVSDSPYTTIVHRDVWTSNVMIAKDADGNVSNVKIFDFQLYFYHSFVLDLVYFLFTSVRIDDLNNHFESFIKCYHRKFYKTLSDVNCPLDQYTYELMWIEFKKTAKLELLHTMFMITLVMVDGDSTPKMDDISEDTFNRSCKPSTAVIERIRNLILKFNEYELV